MKNNEGYFEDVTEEMLPSFQPFGIVTDAQWADINQDGRKDLILVGEYSPVVVLLNLKRRVSKTEIS